MSATRSQFEVELKTVRDRLLEMGSDADHVVDLAMRALTEQANEMGKVAARAAMDAAKPKV